MNAKTLEAVKRHGESLLLAFPNATEKNPVALCKKLRRIETAVAKPILDYCNGENGVTIEQVDAACQKALTRLEALFPQISRGLKKAFINRDPRGYALKLDDQWTQTWNHRCYANNTPRIYTDMGGYGILAPDLTIA